MPVLAYWSIRGLAQPARLLLHYVGEEYEDKQYNLGPAPQFNKDSWLSEKHSLGLDFPNLPYYIDGGNKITQSNAVLRYIGRKHNLCGNTEVERSRVDIMADQVMDLRNGLVGLCYNPAAKSMLEDYLKNLKPTLESFEKFIGNRQFFCADKPTFPDFHMYEMLAQHRLMFKDSIKGYAKLNAFMDRFEALPAIRKYLASGDKLPCNLTMAAFGNTLKARL